MKWVKITNEYSYFSNQSVQRMLALNLKDTKLEAYPSLYGGCDQKFHISLFVGSNLSFLDVLI